MAFNKEARIRFLKFAHSSDAAWKGNFRDLNAAVARMATLSAGGRISVEVVVEEITRLRSSWSQARTEDPANLNNILPPESMEDIDLFDKLQLKHVVDICRRSRTLSEAGRQLFGVSRMQRATSNDADRLRKYLARFGLSWSEVSRSAPSCWLRRPGLVQVGPPYCPLRIDAEYRIAIVHVRTVGYTQK